MQIKKICLAVAGIFILVTRVSSQEKPLPLDSAVRTGKLPNGFTYYIRHNEQPKNRVLFYLANKVGSVLEDDDQRGLAHFIEHMSFDGTTHFPKNELINYLQKSGIRFGSDLNAHTGFDETVYQLPLPADDPVIIQNGVQIMRDWAHGDTFDPIEIDKERGVVMEEKRLGKGSSERMHNQYWPMLVNDSRYAVREPIGMDNVIQNFKPQTIRDFYHDWYRPDLQALIVVGDIDIDQMEKIIKNKFSDLTNPKPEKPRINYSIKLDGDNHFMEVTDKEMSRTTAEIIIKHKSHPVTTESAYRNGIAIQIFDEMLRARLEELSSHSTSPFVTANAGITDFSGDLDSFDASFTAKPDGLENGFKALWREVIRIQHFGFTATELERAKRSYFNVIESALTGKSTTGSQDYVQAYLDDFLKNEAAPGINTEYQLSKSALPQITLDVFKKLAQNYIVSENRDILILAPDADKPNLPKETLVYSWLKEVETENLKPYEDEISGMPLLNHEPIPGKIIQEEKNIEPGITRLTLSNGIKVLLKPTDFKTNEIIFSAFSAGGTSLYDDTDYPSAANSAGIINSFGTGNYNASQLSKFLSGKQLSVLPYISESTQGVTGFSAPKDLETAFQLTYSILTEPRKDEDQFNAITQRSRIAIANRGAPATVFNDSVTAILYNYNMRRTAPTTDKLDHIKLNLVYNIYKDRYADASGMTFIFVGSFDEETIKPLLEKYIASLPSNHSDQQAKDLGIRTAQGRIEKNIYKGSESKAIVRLLFTGGLIYNEQELLQLDALKETLQIRLLERLREEESGVYSPGTFVVTDKFPNAHYVFRVSFSCAPQNVNKLIASALDEINKIKTDGPPLINIDKYKAEDQRVRETALKTNRWWLNYLNNQLQNKGSLNEVDNYTADQQLITRESLKKTAQKYLSGKNYIQMVLLPETLLK